MPTAINEQIKILVELQKIDGQVYHLKKELASHPDELKRVDADFEKKKAGLKAAEDALKAAQVKQKEKELELGSKEEKIKKLASQLYSLKSNKEYAAMEMEIKGHKADNSLIEEEILRSMDAVELMKTKVAHEKELLKEEEKKHNEIIAAVKAKSAVLEAEIAAEEEKRKVYTPNIEPRLLAQYEKLLKNREGLALSPVRHNACSGCHLGMPPQRVNEIQMGEKLLNCESCDRILYWAP